MSLSYLKSSSIHTSHNRAINILRSNYFSVESNVIHDIRYDIQTSLMKSIPEESTNFNSSGRAIVLENGTEIGHQFMNNLLIFIRPSVSQSSVDFETVGFWVSYLRYGVVKGNYYSSLKYLDHSSK